MKNYDVVKENLTIMVYDNSITKHYSQDKIIATVVSHHPDDDVSCQILAINVAELFRDVLKRHIELLNNSKKRCY